MTAPLDDALRTQLRGYRREQVDEVIRVLEGRVAAHDRAIAHLRGEAHDPMFEHPDEAPGFLGPRVTAAALAPDDASQTQPGRAGNTSRDRSTTEPSPLPWRRSDLAAPAVYLLVAVWLLSGLVADLRTGYLSQGVQDQQAFEWYFGATAHNLVTFSNPLFTDLQNFPDGVNLMANAAVLGLGVPLAPLTLLAGPSATFVLVEVLGLALTASAWFWLFRRRLAVHPLLAAIGAGFVGFAPGMVSHANGHPNFVAQFLVPVIVDRVIRLAQGGRPRRDAVVLGLLAAWQVFIGEEVLLLTAIGLAIAAPVVLAHHREVLRPLARGLALGAGVCLAIVAVPLWWQFAGPRSYTSIWHPPGGNDLAQLWGRATRSIGADVWASAALSMNRTEENSFFGIPLLLAAVAVVIALWRRPAVQALGVVVLISCWFSLGEEVVVNGRSTGIPAPGVLFEHVPILENVLPTRFALIAVPALGALLAIGAEEVRRAVGRSSASPGAALAAAAGAAGLVLLPVLPTPLVVDQRAPMPQFFVDGSWKDWVDEGGSVLAAPAPWVGDTRALEWQAQARWGFPVVAGYFVGPDTTPERGGQYGATPTGLTQWMAAIAEADQPTLATPEQVEEFTTNLRQGRVDAIVLPQGRPAEGALLASLSSAFGEPVTTGGVHVWDVRSVTDGAG
ncbi:MAG TPA: hypothetical protein PLU20_00385 [Ornithinibacter sp.]|nr:hypothetical protein [Ornithinibacter sp.]